jgi:trigger factor
MEELGLSKEILSEKYRDTAEKKVKRHLILGKIVEQEDMTLADQEMEDGFKEMAQTFNQPLEDIKNYYKQNEDKIEFFKHTLLEKKAVNLIIKSSTIEEVEPELKQDPETSS